MLNLGSLKNGSKIIEIFRKIAQYYLKDKKNIQNISIRTVSEEHPHVAILQVNYKDKRSEKFVMKILTKKEGFTDRSIIHTMHEVAICQELKKLGFKIKECLFFDPNGSLLGFPFSISTYLEGKTLNNCSREEIGFLLSKTLNNLYKLHSGTSLNPLISSFNNKRRVKLQRKLNVEFGKFEAEYLLSDIERDNLNFTDKEMEDLKNAIDLLNKAKSFCLCHCDVNPDNLIRDDKEVYFIDWSYSHFSEPALDIACVIFWLLEFNLLEQAKKEVRKRCKQYKEIGFDIIPRFPFYLAHKFIEYGRLRGEDYIIQGKSLLDKIPEKSVNHLILVINSLHSQKKERK